MLAARAALEKARSLSSAVTDAERQRMEIRARLVDFLEDKQNLDKFVAYRKAIYDALMAGESWDANPQARVVDVMQPGPRTFRPDLDPKDAQKALHHSKLEAAIVTTSDGELLGIVRIAQKKTQKARKAA